MTSFFLPAKNVVRKVVQKTFIAVNKVGSPKSLKLSTSRDNILRAHLLLRLPFCASGSGGYWVGEWVLMADVTGLTTHIVALEPISVQTLDAPFSLQWET